MTLIEALERENLKPEIPEFGEPEVTLENVKKHY